MGPMGPRGAMGRRGMMGPGMMGPGMMGPGMTGRGMMGPGMMGPGMMGPGMPRAARPPRRAGLPRPGAIRLMRFDFDVQFCWQPKTPSERDEATRPRRVRPLPAQ